MVDEDHVVRSVDRTRRNEGGPRRARRIPLRRAVPALARDPLNAFEAIGRDAQGEVIQIALGPFRPYLITSPEDVQRVLRDRADNYLREGMLWKPMRRFLGTGIFSDGPEWVTSRSFMQPLFSAKYVSSMIEGMAEAVELGVDRLDEAADSGRVVDATTEMARIAHRVVLRVFFGDRVSPADGERLIRALDAIAVSVTSRLLLPFMPGYLPMPGDRLFRRATRVVDGIMFPLIEQSRRMSLAESDDLITRLCHTRGADDATLTDRQVRDYVVSLLAAGTETTTMSLTWIWIALHANPSVTRTLNEEIKVNVGEGPVAASHLPRLRYTKMVIEETLRLYPVGWILPRRAMADDVIGGVRIRRGSTVLLSPYLTHRIDRFWDRPHVFDPLRFTPEAADGRPRFAYFPFSGGIHQCLGSHFFTVEAQLILATVLSRFSTRILNKRVLPRAGITLRPRHKVRMVLTALDTSVPRPTT